jgi:DNA-binding response OmpR family regulator
VLLNIKLPKVDGIEVLAIIKVDRDMRQILVVMLTSSKEEADVLASYDLGTNAYVVKPLGSDEFMKAVRNLGAFWGVVNMPPVAYSSEPALTEQ